MDCWISMVSSERFVESDTISYCEICTNFKNDVNEDDFYEDIRYTDCSN